MLKETHGLIASLLKRCESCHDHVARCRRHSRQEIARVRSGVGLSCGHVAAHASEDSSRKARLETLSQFLLSWDAAGMREADR